MRAGVWAVFVSVATWFGAFLRSSPPKTASHFAPDCSPLSNSGEFVKLIGEALVGLKSPAVTRGRVFWLAYWWKQTSAQHFTDPKPRSAIWHVWTTHLLQPIHVCFSQTWLLTHNPVVWISKRRLNLVDLSVKAIYCWLLSILIMLLTANNTCYLASSSL